MRALSCLSLAALLLLGGEVGAQPRRTQDLSQMPGSAPNSGSPAEKLLQVPVSNLSPGGVPSRPEIKNPAAGDPNAIERGHKYYIQFNCVGCHADNGGGGMGVPLSDDIWIYGFEPENVYLSIYQGRPNGMPAWGGMLPQQVIWDLVAYVRNLSEKPDGKYGKVIRAAPPSPMREQVPAQRLLTSDPWSHTEPFAMGQQPQSDEAAKRQQKQNAAPPGTPAGR